MSEAPKEIVASVFYENVNGKRLRMGHVTAGTDGVPMPFDPIHYIRRDVHRALLKAEREKALREAASLSWLCFHKCDVEIDVVTADDILALISEAATDG